MERQLVEHLVNHDLVSRQEMQRSILRASMRKSTVVEQLLEDGQVDESLLARLMADYYGYAYLDSVNIDAQPYALKLISGELAEKHGVLPYKVDAAREQVTLAIYDPVQATDVVELLRTAMGTEPEIVITARGRLQREIFRHYRGTNDDATPAAVLTETAEHEGAGLGRHLVETRELSAISPELLSERAQSAPPPLPDGIRERSTSGFSGLYESAKPLSGVLSLAPAGQGRSRSRSGGKGGDADFLDSGGPTRAVSDATGFQFISDSADFAHALDNFDAALEESMPLSFDSGFGRGSNLEHRTGSDLHSLSSLRLANDPAGLREGGPSSVLGASQDEFDLFDEPGEKKEETVLTLQQIVEQNHQKIRRLEREVEHQRAILQTLADLLVEARVISRKQLKDRLKALRKSE